MSTAPAVCLQEPAQRVGGQGNQGRCALPPSGALGAAQGRCKHYSVAAHGRRLAGRVSAVRGMQGDAGAVRPACDLHGGARAVVLRTPHRPRCPSSQAHLRAADAYVQRKQLRWQQRMRSSCCWCWQRQHAAHGGQQLWQGLLALQWLGASQCVYQQADYQLLSRIRQQQSPQLFLAEVWWTVKAQGKAVTCGCSGWLKPANVYLLTLSVYSGLHPRSRCSSCTNGIGHV
jgi:hypothetical protein